MHRLSLAPNTLATPLSRRQALQQLRWLPAAALAAQAGTGWASTARTRRLVSVGGALTEIVYALDAQAELVGVDTTSTYPEAVRQLPSVGYARTLSAEGILALAPTQVIVSDEAGPPAVLRQITAAGVPLTQLAARHRFEGVLERVQRLGELTGRPHAAQALNQRLQQEWQAARRQIDGRSGAPVRALFILAHNPAQVMVSGRDTQADAMLAYAGAVNVIHQFNGYKPLSAEAVIAARPDVVVLTDQGLQASGGISGVLRLPGLTQTPAGRAQRIVALDAMFLLGFGPRLPAAVQALDLALRKTQA